MQMPSLLTKRYDFEILPTFKRRVSKSHDNPSTTGKRKECVIFSGVGEKCLQKFLYYLHFNIVTTCKAHKINFSVGPEKIS